MSDRVIQPEEVAAARLEAQQMRTRLQQAKLRIKRGELVRREKIDAVSAQMMHRVRDAVLAIASRQSAILAAKHGVDPAKLHIGLEHAMITRLQRIHDALVEAAARDTD